MTNLHESYLAGHGFDITTPRLKTDDRSAALPTVLPGPVNRVHVCIYMCAQSKNRYNSRIVLRKVGILTLLRKSGMVTIQF